MGPRIIREVFRACFILAILATAGKLILAFPLYTVPQFAASSGSSAVTVGEFNGDSIPDLAVPSITHGVISVFLGRGGGEFVPAQDVPVGGGPNNFTSPVVIGDFNADNMQDLVAANSGSNDLSIALGHGDGTFAPQFRVSSLGQAPGGLAVGDLNGDGRDDLVVTNTAINEVSISVHLNQNNGTFASSRIVVPTRPLNVAIGDLNRDGRADLAVAGNDPNAPDVNTASYVQILLGNGSGAFAIGQIFHFGPVFDASGVAVGDVNGDDIPDVLAIASPGLAVFLGRGDGTFVQGTSVVGCCGNQLSIVDLNGDGRVDLNGGSLRTFLGVGDGTFTRLNGLFPEVGGPTALADFNDDGVLDVVMARVNTVFFGRGDGTFVEPDRYPASLSGAMLVDDLNSDGHPDILFGNGNIIVVPGLENGVLASQIVIPSGAGTVAVAVGDFNGDGKKDLVGASSQSYFFRYRAWTHLGNGDLTFSAGVAWPVGEVPAHVTVGDFNGDNRDDIAVANKTSNDVSILLGNGDGTFATEIRYAVGTSPRFLLVGDFDANGREDLAVANNMSLDVSILLGNGDGTFAPQVRYAVGGYPIGMAVGDFDQDGIQDLVVSDDLPYSTGGSAPPDSAAVLTGAGDGTFGPPNIVSVGDGPSVPIVADLNFDGLDDIALTYIRTYTVTILPGTAAGVLGPEVRYGIYPDPVALVTTEYNGDGIQDLYVAGALGVSGRVFALSSRVCMGLCDRALDVTLDIAGPRGAGVLSWRTDSEFSIAGFNVVMFDQHGNRVQQNPVIIPCEGCVDLSSHSYTFHLPKHKSGRDLFVELVHRDGQTVLFGPATKQ